MGADSGEIAEIVVGQTFGELFQAGLPGGLTFGGRRGAVELGVAESLELVEIANFAGETVEIVVDLKLGLEWGEGLTVFG